MFWAFSMLPILVWINSSLSESHMKYDTYQSVKIDRRGCFISCLVLAYRISYRFSEEVKWFCGFFGNVDHDCRMLRLDIFRNSHLFSWIGIVALIILIIQFIIINVSRLCIEKFSFVRLKIRCFLFNLIAWIWIHSEHVPEFKFK